MQPLGSGSMIFLPQCSTLVKFGAANESAPCQTARARTLSTSCGPQVTFWAATAGESTSATYTLILRGPYSGTAVQTVSSTLRNVSDQANVSLTADGRSYTLGNVSVNVETGLISANPLYPQPVSASSGGGGVLGSSLFPIAAGLVGLMVVLAVVVVALHRKYSPRRDGRVVNGVDNPMYTAAANSGFALELVPGGNTITYPAYGVQTQSAHDEGDEFEEETDSEKEFGFDSTEGARHSYVDVGFDGLDYDDAH